MREIKFRAWLKTTNEMVDVKSIHFETSNIRYNDLKTKEVRSAGFENIELMQYTGLKDKNGKEIYEGDIIDIHQTVNGQNLFIITFDGLNIVPKYLFGKDYEYSVKELLEIDIPYFEEKENEVIGNIYENKDLLEE